MQPDVSPPGNGEPKPALPPVLPPSGGHIVRLFVVPGVIVLVVVVLLLGWVSVSDWFFGTARPTDRYLGDMRSANPDVRWRAASDFAQKLKRDPQLATDARLGLELAELLNQSVDDLDRLATEAAKSESAPGGKAAAVATFKKQREYTQFLTACLGNMSVPVGVTELTRLAEKDKGGDPKTTALLRRQAVWALANLGENCRQFAALPAEQRDPAKTRIMAELHQEADGGNLLRGQWARQTLNRWDGTEEYGVIPVLSRCADADDPDLRMWTAFALGFWKGSPAENALAEQTLLKLSSPDREQGRGERVLLGRDD
jgi:hypothetical protein